DSRLTTTGLVLGTPYYMSPEQARGDSNITPAADLYALGVILSEMIIGSVPIEGENYNQLLYRVITGEFTPPRQRRADVPEALERVILHAMALEPGQRPSSATELEHALIGFCRGTFREHSRRAPRMTGNPTAAQATTSNSGVGTEETLLGPAAAPGRATPSAAHPRSAAAANAGAAVAATTAAVPRRSRTPLIAAVVGFVGIAAGAGVIAMRGDATSPTQPTPHAANREPPPTLPSTPAEPPKPAPPPMPSPVAPDPEVTLRFDVDPASATILIDGKPITGTEHVVPRDDATHKLRITAPGYAPHADELRFDESQKLSVVLKKTGRPGKKPRKPQRIDDESPYK
ncbi:MAG: serine/threonine protein kinase, partial [Kofleriaceae bacterium]